MSAYELPDALVQRIVSGNQQVGDGDNLRIALRDQLPIPVPAKLGAVVQDHAGAKYVRVTEDTPHEHEWWNNSEGQWCATEALPRIRKVLSTGVDL